MIGFLEVNRQELPMLLPCQRDKFDMPADVAYFNAAYMTPLTHAQVKAGEAALKRGAQSWTIVPEDFFTESEVLRVLGASLFGASPDDMAIVPSASYGSAVAAKNLPLEAGDVILHLDAQFPSNVYEWRDLADRTAAQIHVVQTPVDHDWTSAVLEAIEQLGERLAILALPQVHWSSGALLDLVAIGKAARDVGAELFLDLSQSIGAVPINMAEVKPAFAVAASYKWMMGPYGLGLMYVRPDFQEGRPLEQNWIVRQGAEDFSQLVHYVDDYQAGARRFDVGERASLILTPILNEGIKQLLDWGVDHIAETLQKMNDGLAESLTEFGFKAIERRFRGPNMLGLDIGSQAGTVMDALKAENVQAGVRGNMLRLAPHLWVSDDDQDRLLAVLRNAIR